MKVRTAGGFRSLLWLWGYEWSNVFFDIGLRNALLQGVLHCHVYAMDIFRLWDVRGSIDEIYVYEGLNGFLRGRLTVAGRGD